MKLAPAIALAAMMILACPAFAMEDEGTDPGDLVGVWKLKSFDLQVLGSNGPREVFGSKPRGYLIFTREGRMMTIITRADRKPATTVEEQAALLQSMISYTGRYKVEGSRVVTTPDVSWNEIYTGAQQIRYYTLHDEELSLTTAPQASGVIPGSKIIATLTYEREE
jgi:Lipocalin-like domain